MERATPSYPGYPTERLRLSLPKDLSLNGIALPEGAWNCNNDPLPTPEQTASFCEAGLEVDALGRPLHPWAHDILQDEGAILGRGFYWNWGPNKTADPIIITEESEPRILLIRRSDTGALALPGGFIDTNESGHDAAIREAAEETGLHLKTEGTLVYQGPVADRRTTLHAWAETSAYLFHVPNADEVHGADDALDAQWYPLSDLPDNLYGSHAELVRMALERRTHPPSIRDILKNSEGTTTVINGGHMAYDHLLVEHETQQFFIKAHDQHKFTDPIRERHSRAYLEKEAAYYEHLLSHKSPLLPASVELIEDTVLAMEYLSPHDGWHWRAPHEELDTYTAHILSAFEALQTLDTLPAPHPSIKPAYDTFYQEGWPAVTDDTLSAITARIEALSASWNDTQRRQVTRLIEMLPALHAERSDHPPLDTLFPAHNDARQSNIAWHPEHGVRIVDWSWADLAPKHADATMFLIDLHKSGCDVRPYMHSFNDEFAYTLIGYWLAQSTRDARTDATNVREQQIASASAAFDLLHQFMQES